MSGYVRLVRDLAGAPADQPRWPADVALIPFGASMAPQAHALLVQCYADGHGAVPAGFDTWWFATRHDPEFDAALCFCARRADRLVGFALCWTSAFIKDLVVAPHVRSQGVGEALLRHAFVAFSERGAKEVALKVEVANATALRLYRRVGFRPSAG